MNLAVGPARRLTTSSHYKWWVYGAVATGMFVTVMDQSGVNIAIPGIADQFDADIPAVQWVTLGYVLSTSAFLLPMGRLADMVGRARVYLAGLLVFMGLAAIAGAAQMLPMLIAAKVLQGVGAAAIQANGMAMIVGAFPDRERGRAVGLHMTVIGTGSISGPIIGGLLISGFGWRSVFYAGIPMGLIAVAAGLAVLRREAPTRLGSAGARFDWPGAGMSSGALITFLLGMTNGQRLGLGSPFVVAAFSAAILLFVAFIWWERRASDPMLDLGLFRSKLFSMGVSARFVSFLGSSSVFFLMPFYLMQILGYPASRAGLMMVPGSICMAIMGPISGRLSDRIGTRWLAVAGMALSAAAMFTFSRLTVDSTPLHVMFGMVLSGSGMGIFASTNTSAVMSALGREKYGIVSALLSVTRTSANVTGIALATTIVAVAMGSLGYEPSLAGVADEGSEGVKLAFTTGMQRAYLLAVALVLIAMVLSALRGESIPNRALLQSQ